MRKSAYHYAKMTETYLSEKNGVARDLEVTFEPTRHVYTIKDSKALTPPVSVTTLTSRGVWPAFDPDATIDRIMQSEDYKSGESKYAGMSRSQIRKQWDEAGLEARTEGTRLHDQIERYYNRGTLSETSSPAPPSKRGTLSPTSPPLKKRARREEEPRDWRQFVAWATAPEQAHLVPYRTEWRIFSRKCNVAGSVDMVFHNTKTNRLDIYDWKRSKEIKRNGFGRYATHPLLKDDEIPDANYYKYSLQLAAYKYILETEYDLPYPIGELWLVRMDGDEGREMAEAIEAMDLSGPINKLMEQRWF